MFKPKYGAVQRDRLETDALKSENKHCFAC